MKRIDNSEIIDQLYNTITQLRKQETKVIRYKGDLPNIDTMVSLKDSEYNIHYEILLAVGMPKDLEPAYRFDNGFDKYTAYHVSQKVYDNYSFIRKVLKDAYDLGRIEEQVSQSVKEVGEEEWNKQFKKL